MALKWLSGPESGPEMALKWLLSATYGSKVALKMLLICMEVQSHCDIREVASVNANKIYRFLEK